MSESKEKVEPGEDTPFFAPRNIPAQAEPGQESVGSVAASTAKLMD